MLLHIWMKVGSKLPYEELKFKIDFCIGWHTFSWVTSDDKIKHTEWMQLIYLFFIKKSNKIMVADLNLFGSLGTCIALAILSVCLFWLNRPWPALERLTVQINTKKYVQTRHVLTGKYPPPPPPFPATTTPVPLTKIKWNIIPIKFDSKELCPGYGFWVCVHCDLDLVDMTLGQDHDTPLSHGK